MKLNHINLVVEDPKATQRFLVDVFGLKSMGEGSAAMVGLRDASGSTLVLMRAKGQKAPEYPPGFHIGFIQTDEEAVDTIHAGVRSMGIDCPETERARGGYQFCFDAPGGFMVEVSC